ncbi:MAG: hypothetical protein SVO01_00135 [Thermotogota bacterium]|nr:hypothetical protein [Thermotogota bacterium]
MDVLDKIRLNIRKGVSGTGALFGELPDRQGLDVTTILEPGDLIIRGPDGKPIFEITAPIAYDVWYLQHAVNMLSIENASLDSITDEYLSGPLSFFEDDMGEIKPLSFIRSLRDLAYGSVWSGRSISASWNSYTEFFIHLMPFEVWSPNVGEQYGSDGPSKNNGFDRNDVVGYLAFPVGQLGAMEVISVFCYSDIEDLDLTKDLVPNADMNQCRGFFPPIDENTGKNKCMGRHLIESGYLVDDGNRRGVELMARPYPESAYEYIDGKPNFWLRFWLHGDETFPVPGDFVMILCKPLALPPHIWWFQKTNPFVYAGNWFETNNLTGGEVTAVTAEADRTDGGVGSQYTVKVQGREIKINASDFLEYEVGDWVGVLKVGSVSDSPATQSFCWLNQERITAADAGQAFDNDQYVIVPIDFYSEV